MTTRKILAPYTFPSTGTNIPNRTVLAAMTNKQSHADGSLSEDEQKWLAARATGGFGIVTTCAAHVSLDGQGWEGELGVFDDSLLPGLTRLAEALRSGAHKKKRTQPGRAESSLVVGSGGRIRTYDLRVMSPTSCLTAPPRD